MAVSASDLRRPPLVIELAWKTRIQSPVWLCARPIGRGCVVRRVRALVLGIAVLVHRPLAAVPENGLKFAVGVMLTTSSSAIAGSCSPVRSPPFSWRGSRHARACLLRRLGPCSSFSSRPSAAWALGGRCGDDLRPGDRPRADPGCHRELSLGLGRQPGASARRSVAGPGARARPWRFPRGHDDPAGCPWCAALHALAEPLPTPACVKARGRRTRHDPFMVWGSRAW